MLLKTADSKDEQVAELEELLATAPSDKRSKIKQELYAMRAGIKGEKDAAYLINFDYEKSENWIILHDLRLEIKGRVAQIDHVLINRLLGCYVLESKHFNSGLKINDDGEFLRSNDYQKKYEGMPSPLAQNERHIAVLKEAFEDIKMPERLGMRLMPTFHSLVIISANARIMRPDHFDTSQIIKADALKATIDKQTEQWGILKTLGNATKLVDQGSLYAIGRRLMAMHSPIRINYAERFGLQVSKTVSQASTEVAVAPPPELASSGPGPSCKHCRSSKGAIQYGKYGYYFKCSGCDGNTGVRGDCAVAAHPAKLRKAGLRFFSDCEACGSSTLYFVNPESATTHPLSK